MAISLYDATVPSWLQILKAVRSLTEKAESFCAEKGRSEQELLASHFGPDMLPLAWQIKWTCSHSLGAIEGVRAGSFSPDRSPPAESFAALRAQIDETVTQLEAIRPEEIEAFIGRDMAFSMPERNLLLPFTAENFLLSFSMPNFYFHAATAYDLLRHAGVEIGKPDFMGRPRLKMPAVA